MITIPHEHQFILSTKYEGYEVCLECGSYHSIRQEDPKKIYVDMPYWGDGTGRSTLSQQVENFNCTDDCGISKADRIMQFVPKEGGAALEIACCPGVLLKRLAEVGYDAYGIEPSSAYVDFIRSQAPNATILEGFFPEITRGFKDDSFDCIISSDVMEHCDNYDTFFKEAHRLLKPGGIMITMSPIILTADGLHRKRDFDFPDQHCWIFTQSFLEPYLKSIFSEANFLRWIVGHELVVTKK